MDKNDDFEDKIEENTDEFGLPDPGYKPLDEEANQQTRESDSRYTFPEDEEKESRGTLIAVIVVVAVLLIGGGLLGYFLYFKPKQERERQEQLAAQKRAQKAKEEARLAKLKQQQEEDRKKAVADSIANAEAKASSVAHQRGSISKLDSPTGRYHLVVSSALDDDLITDYAKKLRRKGISTKIISPYGKVRFYRLVMGEDYGTFDEARQKAVETDSGYKYGVWVLKY